MNHKGISLVILLLSLSLFYTTFADAENIDPNDDGSQYAYGENIGWINFEPNVPEPNVGAMVSGDKLTGFIWAENIGWINLDPNDTDPNTGVKNNGAGLLAGFAWAENVGWINFNPKVPGDPNYYGVTIDSEGNFAGWAWGENIGWIHFRNVCIVDFEHFASFALQWLETGMDLEADLYEDGKVDLFDLMIFTALWLDYCPDGWQLSQTAYKVKTSWTD